MQLSPPSHHLGQVMEIYTIQGTKGWELSLDIVLVGRELSHRGHLQDDGCKVDVGQGSERCLVVALTLSIASSVRLNPPPLCSLCSALII